MLKIQIKQPEGFYVLVFGELVERFSYYGTQVLLVLCLTKVFFLNDTLSYSLYGAYAMFAYALPVLGGLLADRFLGIRQAVIIGGLLLISGNFLMALQHLNSFYLGLALTACGTGLYKPNSTAFIGKLYAPGDTRRDSGYTLFYIGMNIGATISPFIYGFNNHLSYGYNYLISVSLLLISWFLFLIKTKHNKISNEEPNKSLQKSILAYGFILIGISCVNFLFFYPTILNSFLVIFSLLALVILFMAIFKYEKVDRNRLIAILVLSTFGMCFFSASLQVGSSINLFIDRDLYRILGNWQIPTIMFTALYPLAVILIAPFVTLIWLNLAAINKEPSVSSKIALGLVLASIGFMFFMLAAQASKYSSPNHLGIIFIFLGNLALGTGEVCLMPPMLSAISQFIPKNIQSTIIGVWFLFIAFGGYLSSIMAKLSSGQTVDTNINLSSQIYSKAFTKVSIISLLIAIILFTLTPWLKSLIKN